VIFALPKDRTGGIKRYVELCEQRGVTVKIVLDLFDLRIAKSYVHSVGTLPVLTYHTVCLNETQLLLKRVMDIVGALFGILITGLLSIFIIPAIELDSRGPVLFAQPRVGQNGRVFKLLKFRSMCVNADSMKRDFMAQNEVKGGFMFKIKNDPESQG
jgi:lipopolysaccharide/colanic/teichoic acid biosynthesis glycosyltransferase